MMSKFAQKGDNLKMRKRILPGIFIFACLIVIGVAYLNSDLAKLFTNRWKVEGYTYCNQTYHVCIDNVPKWTVYVPPVFRGLEDLCLKFTYELELENKKIQKEARILFSIPEPLKNEDYEIKTAEEYLSSYLREQANKLKDYNLIKVEPLVLINGQAAASARFEYTTPKGILCESEVYGFVRDGHGYMIIYADRKKTFTKNYDAGMRIINSFRFLPN